VLIYFAPNLAISEDFSDEQTLSIFENLNLDTGLQNDSGEESTGIIQDPIPPIPQETWEVFTDIQTGTEILLPGTGLQYGDIQITEVFPSSGNCLDEFVKLHFSVAYKGIVEIYGLGTSTASVKVGVDVEAWADLIIADQLAGMIPSDAILLVPTVTLTNGGELLKVIVSGIVLDEVRYSGLVGAQSLTVTPLYSGGAERLFTTNIPGSPPTTCAVLPSPVQLTGGLGQCDIKLNTMTYLGTGSYSLSFQTVWQSLTECDNNVQLSWEWLINWISHPISNCKLDLQTQLWANIIEFKLYNEEGNLSCYDQFVFATNYDLGIVKQYVSSSSSSSGQSCEANPSNQTDCGLQFQWSKLGFFAGYGFNFVAVLNNKQLSNTQKSYKCSIDMGDGNFLDQCNPPIYIYQTPWVHTVSLDIIDKNTNQLLCKTRTFVNAPIKKTEEIDWYTYWYALNTKLADYCSAVRLNPEEQYEIEEERPSCNSLSVQEMCKVFASTGYLEDIIPNKQVEDLNCDTGVYDLRLYSVLPNPKWSDSIFEQFTLFNSGLSTLSDMSNYTVEVGSKTIQLSGSVNWGSTITYTGGWSLVNNGMCISLVHSSCGIIEKQCYPKVKEGEEFIFNSLSWESINNQMSWTSTKARIAKLNNKIAAPQFKTTSKKSAELSCTEKISIAKQKEKVKYDKLKLSRANDKIKYKNSLDLRTIKERIARNNRTLYENMNKLILQTLKAERPSVLEQSSIPAAIQSASYLESLISSGYVYTLKDSLKHTYKYLNNISAYLKKKEKPKPLDVLYPGITEYFELLDRYSINVDSIKKLKK
jgi:hypothetical protein